MSYKLTKSTNKNKKYTVITPLGKRISFGAIGYSDYTIHRDPERQKRYITRHRSRENWNKSGINTAGFWSRWILWNKPSLQGSINDTSRRFGIKISKS